MTNFVLEWGKRGVAAFWRSRGMSSTTSWSVTIQSPSIECPVVPWLDAHALIDQFGQVAPFAVALIVFVETAFILTSFLPGDSLLFVLGITLAANFDFPVWLAIPLVTLAAFAGGQAGYLTGRAIGPALFERRHTWIFNPMFVTKTHRYFQRYGSRAIIVARFVPVVRALVPMLAGISRTNARSFVLYNALGATIWVAGLVGAGYALGGIPFVANNLETAILVVIIVTSLPFPIEMAREWITRRRAG